jgi:GxxExxY protein
MNIEIIFKQLLDSSFKVHTSLGPGLLESAYQECLYYELTKIGLKVEKQKALPLIYEEVKLDIGYRIDLMIENCIVTVPIFIGIKSIDTLCDIHMAQILTYMRLSDCKLGLLVNFNVYRLKEGIKRVIL